MATDDSTKQDAFWDTGEPVKRCIRCGKIKPLSEFSFKSQRIRRRSSYCKPCVVAKSRDWMEKNPERRIRTARDCHIRRHYGLTREDYARMFREQEGVCKICGNPEKEMDAQKKPRPLAVDHDHATGAARDLLCADCNHVLGYARDNPATLRAAADYLERHAANGG